MIDLGQLRELTEALNAADDTSRRQAIHSVKDYAEKDWAAVPIDLTHALIAALHRQLVEGNKRTIIRQEIAITLGNLGCAGEVAVAPLIGLLQDGVPDGVREEAASALGKIGKKAKGAVEALAGTLSHCRTPLALRVIAALDDIGAADAKARPALVNLWLTTDQSQQGQVHLALALCKLKIEAAGLVAFLTRTLVSHQDAGLRVLASDALALCSAKEIDVVPALLNAALHDKDEKVRLRADAGLTQLHLSHEKAVVICAKQLKDSSHAEAALRNSGQNAVPALIEAVKSHEPEVIEKALRILGSLGELAVDAAPAVAGVSHDKDMIIRLAAAKCLWNISKNAEVVVPLLVDLLAEKWPAGHDDEVRRRFLQTIIEALGRIGPPAHAAVPTLVAKTKDKNRLVAGSALTAIKVIAPTLAVKT